jgi:fused signal recognition particle receptor
MNSDLLIPALGVLILVVFLVTLVRVRTRGRGPAPDLDEVDVETLEEMLEADVEAPVLEEELELEPVEVPEAPPQPVVPKVSRLARGLTKTRSALASTLKALKLQDRLEPESWDEIEEALIRADVGIDATDRVITALRKSDPSPEDLQPALRTELVEILNKGDSSLNLKDGEVSVWLVIGVNGVGKTTSIAKLAHRLKGEGKSVVLAAGDTFRAAAIEQLGTWAGRLDLHMVKHAQGADPGAVVFDALEHAKAKSIDVVIVDTAGRLHTKANLMDELKKVKRIADRESSGVAEVLLVLDATVGQNGLAQARAFQEAMGATGVILTKLDGTARGGIVIAVQEELGIPVKAVGVGEGLDDLETFDAESFVDALLE